MNFCLSGLEVKRSTHLVAKVTINEIPPKGLGLARASVKRTSGAKGMLVYLSKKVSQSVAQC